MTRKYISSFIFHCVGPIILISFMQAHAADLTLQIPESAINESIRSLTDADALGISEYNNKWGVNKWWFQIDSAVVDLFAGGGVNLNTGASAKGNINIADIISFTASGSGNATLEGNLVLRNDSAGRRLLEYTLTNIIINSSQFPGFVTSFLNDVIRLYFTNFGPVKINPGISFLPDIPENAFVSTTPNVSITNDALLISVTPKLVLPDLVLTNLSYEKTGDGYVYKFTAMIANQGDAVAQRNIKVTLYDGNPDSNNDHIVDSPLPLGVKQLAPSFTIELLTKGGSISSTWQVALTNGIDHSIYAVVDSTNTVLESQESNNTLAILVKHKPADLDGNLCVDRQDLNILLAAIFRRSEDLSFDINHDNAVNIADARALVLLFDNKPGGSPCL